MEAELQVGFVGNPNCGKTTLFNAYTGARLKVANWPGVTVEKKEGGMKYHNHKYNLVDLPGIYSLTSYTMEEKLTRQYILEDNVDIIVDVADASSLERNLYLTLSLLELGKPVILALNMMDIVEERGMELDLHRMPEMLGIPAIPVSARKKTGLNILMHTVSHHTEEENTGFIMHYSEEIEEVIKELEEKLLQQDENITNPRWHAIKILEHDEEICEIYKDAIEGVVKKDYESEIINQKFDFIEELIEECVVNKSEKEQVADKVDRILIHPILGLPCFFAIMAFVFFCTFFIGDFLKGYLEIFLAWVENFVVDALTGLHVSNTLISLINEGILQGVGGILSFIPNIIILFLALAILEDSGYMSRVAYVMDGIMSKIGLSGRAFLPMLLGFGCSVPAVMASRVLENEEDRKGTILGIPFMSCSARLPIYVLISSIFFKQYKFLAACSMYFIGIFAGVLVTFVYTKLHKVKEENALLIELPEYKRPNVNTVAIYVGEKVKDYLSKAGTTIFVASIIIWILLNFNQYGMVTDVSQSFAASFGKILAPVLGPIGLGHWQLVVVLISGLAAKEVVVVSFLAIFGIHSLHTSSEIAFAQEQLGALGFHTLNAYCFMLFCLLYTPCIATIATIKKETNSVKWTVGLLVFQLLFAWVVTMVVYQIGSLIM